MEKKKKAAIRPYDLGPAHGDRCVSRSRGRRLRKEQALGLCGLGASRIDGCFFHFDFYPRSDAKGHDVSVDALDGAVNASDGHHILSSLEGVTEVAHFFLFLLLGANHEEIHDSEECHHHKYGGPNALFLCSGLEDCNHSCVFIVSKFMCLKVSVSFSEFRCSKLSHCAVVAAERPLAEGGVCAGGEV